MFGLTETGLNPMRTADIKEAIEEDLKSALGSGIDLTAQSALGQIVGVMADRINSVWEAMEEVYLQTFPETAAGTNQDELYTLNGLTRLPALASVVTVRVFGTEGSTVSLPFILSVDGNENSKFEADTASVIGPATDEEQTIEFDSEPTAGTWRLSYDAEATTDLAFDANAAAVQAALEALTTIGAGNVTVSGDYSAGFTVGFTGTLAETDADILVIDDNDLDSGTIEVTITETVKGGSAHVDMEFTCDVTGPTIAPSGSLTVIDTPLTGIDSAYNYSDATIGRDAESDTDYRIRRLQTLKRAGTATIEGIRNEILLVDFVTAVKVLENVTLVTDANGIPGKAFETYVSGGDDTDIAEAIFSAKPAGIQAFGDVEVDVTDSEGYVHTIGFTRPSDKDVWLEIDITPRTDANEGPVYPDGGDTEVRNTLLTFGQSYEIGKDVVVVELIKEIMNNVDGILDIVIRLGFSSSPTGTVNLDIAADEVAKFASGRITVTQV